MADINPFLYSKLKSPLLLPVRLPFPNSLTRNSYFNTPFLTLTPTVVEISNPGLFDAYLAFKTSNPFHVFTLRTQNLKDYSKRGTLDLGPAVSSLSYHLFGFRPDKEARLQVLSLEETHLAQLNSLFLYSTFITSVQAQFKPVAAPDSYPELEEIVETTLLEAQDLIYKRRTHLTQTAENFLHGMSAYRNLPLVEGVESYMTDLRKSGYFRKDI